MSGVLNNNILEALYKAHFEIITNYIVDICELVVEDYEYILNCEYHPIEKPRKSAGLR